VYVCMYVYIYVHVCMYVCIYIYIYIYIYICMYVRVCMYICMYYVRVRMYICMYIRVYIYICMYIFMYNIERKRSFVPNHYLKHLKHRISAWKFLSKSVILEGDVFLIRHTEMSSTVRFFFMEGGDSKSWVTSLSIYQNVSSLRLHSCQHYVFCT